MQPSSFWPEADEIEPVIKLVGRSAARREPPTRPADGRPIISPLPAYVCHVLFSQKVLLFAANRPAIAARRAAAA